jgi:hypothetical protein
MRKRKRTYQLMTTPIPSQVPNLDRSVLITRNELPLVRMEREVVHGGEVGVVSLGGGSSAGGREERGPSVVRLLSDRWLRCRSRGREDDEGGGGLEGRKTHRTSQIFTVPSSLPLTSHFASACQASEVTFAVWPVRVTSCSQPKVGG